MPRPDVISQATLSQLSKQVGLARPGGMMSKASNPVSISKSGGYAAMESALLKAKKPSAKKLAPGGGKQFRKLNPIG